MNLGINALQTTNRSFALLLIVGILCLSALPMPALSPIFLLVLGIMLGILIIGIFIPEDFNLLLKFYLIAFFLRVFLAFFFHILSYTFQSSYYPGFIFPHDGYCYSVQGWNICRFAEKGIKVTMEGFLKDPNMHILSGNITKYDFFTSHIYSMTGFSPLSLFFINCIAGSIVALVIYLIAKELFSKDVARISSFFAFFWPSFILWSTQNMKEPMIAVLLFILLLSIIYIWRHFHPGYVILSIVSVWALFKIDFPYILITISVIFSLGLFLFVNYLLKNRFVTIIIICLLSIICVILLRDSVLFFISEQSPWNISSYSSIFEFLNFHREVRGLGRLQFLKGFDISSFNRALVFAPLGFLYSLFAPFPWQLGSLKQIMAAPETIVFYILFPFTLRGIVFAYKKRFNQSILLLSIIIVILLFLGIIEGNSGTLFRHRCIPFYLVFIFTAIGISLKKPRVGQC